MAENNEVLKTLYINGTNNKYQMKKLLGNSNKEKKQRVETKNWNLPKECYDYEKQLKMIIDILNNKYNHIDDVTKLIIQQINKKIYNYKQQDILKKHFDEENFLTFEHIINKIV